MPQEIICQHCGKTFLNLKKSKANPPKHCSTQCRRASERTTIQCLNCGTEIIVTKAQAKKRNFCSRKCAAIYNQPPDPSKRSIFTCDWCGKEFEEWTYRQARFCSNQCRSKFAARQPKGTYKPEIHITRICANCGKEYQTTTHQVRLRNSRFCSVECRAAAQSIEKRDEKNPNWKGGFDASLYGPNWGRQSRKVKKRDNHTCQICRYQSGGDKILDVHHIKPLVEFNKDWKRANHLTNLICLCRPCHQQVECGNLSCPKPTR